MSGPDEAVSIDDAFDGGDPELPETPRDAVLPQPPSDDELDGAEHELDEAPGAGNETLRNIVEWIGVIVVALAAALLVQAYAVQAFQIPSGSMEPTVKISDRILVNKLSYRFGDVSRGDLVVFDRVEGTSGPTDQLIKRAIALPGETIEIRDDGRLWIWGPGETAADAFRLDEPYLTEVNEVLAVPGASTPANADVWNARCVNQPREPGRCTLDDTSYFMMGDNRTRSTDSRVFGPVPEDNLVGRAFARVWPSLGTL